VSDYPSFEGRVVRLDARGCLVRPIDPAAAPGLPTDGLWCSVRGRIHLRDRKGQKSPVAVGDLVEARQTAADRGSVGEIRPRLSLLARPAVGRERVQHVMAANVERVAIVSSAAAPPFNPGLVDRILAVVEYSRLEGLLVVNKMDLVDEAPREVEAYRALGYPVVLASAAEGRGIPELRAALSGHATVVCGHSGVGKSSLLNAVQPALGLAVGDVNAVTQRGTHTTTAAVWVEIEGGGAVVDTAGVREFGLFGIPRRDVPWLFRDLAAVAPACRFPDCLHLHEPGCAVLPAVEAGTIAPFRYDSYLRILESLDQAHAP
jgi:ribosome biogenesis GTPase